jgi:uncharacterized protein (DUF302 family)
MSSPGTRSPRRVLGAIALASVILTTPALATPVAGQEEGATMDDGLVTVPSAHSVDDTAERLQAALEERGLTIFGVVDHAANAAGADLELPPTTLILVGNPNLGTPLMQSSRSFAIDLPQKFLVWEDAAGDVHITYNDPQHLADRHGVSDQDEVIETITNALANFAAGAAAAVE